MAKPSVTVSSVSTTVPVLPAPTVAANSADNFEEFRRLDTVYIPNDNVPWRARTEWDRDVPNGLGISS